MKALVAALVAVCIAGCGASFEELEKAAGAGDIGAKTALCRGEMRAAFYVGQKSEAESLAVYDACIKREGL